MRDEEHTAIHEAGHAVAFVRLWPESLIVDKVTIEKEGDVAGHHSAEGLRFPVTDDPDEIASQDAEFDKEAVYHCSGYAALIAAGYSEEDAVAGAWSDFDKAGDFYLVPLALSKQKAVALMCLPENIAAVACIADELMRRKTISGDHVECLIEVTDGTMGEDDYRQYLAMNRIET